MKIAMTILLRWPWSAPPRLHLGAPGGWCVMLRLLEARCGHGMSVAKMGAGSTMSCSFIAIPKRIETWFVFRVVGFLSLLSLGVAAREMFQGFDGFCLIQWLQIIHKGQKQWISLWENLIGFPNKFYKVYRKLSYDRQLQGGWKPLSRHHFEWC